MLHGQMDMLEVLRTCTYSWRQNSVLAGIYLRLTARYIYVPICLKGAYIFCVPIKSPIYMELISPRGV